jgi:hypothetical protein
MIHVFIYIYKMTFFYSSCPGMDQDFMKLSFISNTGLLDVLISEWVAK